MLYIWTRDVVGGVIEASIIIDGEVWRRYEHASDPNGTMTNEFGTAAWGPDSGITLTYIVGGQHLGEAVVSTDLGVKRYVPDAELWREFETLTVSQGFQISVQLMREPVETVEPDEMASWLCVEANIFVEFETVDLPIPLTLAKARQCGVVPIAISLTATVPGY